MQLGVQSMWTGTAGLTDNSASIAGLQEQLTEI
jgi:hypothetical protein